jgi:hypothetical protein
MGGLLALLIKQQSTPQLRRKSSEQIHNTPSKGFYLNTSKQHNK